ncbi:MAG: rhodanese-like domain-containing protein [Actinomycetota bacterium]|nr:rhodanese-like domain-containing protein [Actinomycetota bacterium]
MEPGQEPKNTKTGVNVIDQHEVQRLLDEESAQLVEVLPPQEYEQEHIAGAINMPLKELTSDSVAVLDRSRAVVVYCHDFL